MPELEKYLKNKLEKARAVAVMGIGSELRGDDGAGMIVARRLEKSLSKVKRPRIKIFHGSTAPENLTGEIRLFKPSHLLIVDSVEIGERPGTVLVLSPEDMGGGVSFSTHKMPAKILADYLSKSVGCSIIMIGIQPGSLKFGSKISRSISDSSREVASAIRNSVK